MKNPLALMLTFTLALEPGSSIAETNSQKVDQLLEFCLASGTQQTVGGTVSADGEIKIIGSNLAAEGELLFTREEWSGLIGGLSVNMTDLQAEQANKVRECLEPARAAIFQKIISE